MTWDQGIIKETTTITGEVASPPFGGSGGSTTLEMTYLEAIRDALRYEMGRDKSVLLMGEDIGVYGGAFKVTEGLIETFGEQRVVDTPMVEQCTVGVAVGMAFMGLRPVVEMQFADFISVGFDEIVNYAATNHYRWGAPVPIVIRAPSGGGLRGGPFHSQNPEAWFVHTAGLKVVAPATPADARGLLLGAIRDNNPVIYFENKSLYRSLKGPVPQGEAGIVPIGQAALVRQGEHLSIITYASMVREALLAAEDLAAEGYSVEVLDLRTLKPLDTEAILATVRKTSKVLIVHEARLTCGVGAEVAALIAQHAFEDLDGPITRLTAPDVPVPYAPALEDAFRPSRAKITEAARELLAY
jgi:2-oxoisovalerate dehydrogenase E1 component beta subunit